MIDLDELEAAINSCAFDGDVLGLSKAECRDLLNRLRQAEKDAARYRWLRDESTSVQFSAPLVFNADDCANPESWIDGEHLDHAVDKAMQCSKQNTPRETPSA